MSQTQRVDGLALPEVLEPPFRDYLTFLKKTLNFNRISEVRISQKELDTAANKWFFYQCIRKPSAFSGKITLKADIIATIGGIRGGGKSGLLFNIATHWPKVIGLYGSLDDEILTLLRAHKYLRKWEQCLILGPEGVDVTSSWDYKYYGDLTWADMEKYEVIVMPQKIHQQPKTFSLGCEYVASFLLRRPAVKDYWFLCVTEAANIMWARQSLKNAKLDQAKAYLVWLLRQLRHVGVAIGMDSQYLLALDKEVRNISDYTFLKNLGAFSLPPDLEWVYGYVPPPAIRALYPNEFVATDKFAGVYCGWFRLPPWHKQPKENIYESLGIRWEWGDPELRKFDVAEVNTHQEDMAVHSEIVRAFLEVKTIKGTASKSGHDRDTVRRHLSLHEKKECTCYQNQ